MHTQKWNMKNATHTFIHLHLRAVYSSYNSTINTLYNFIRRIHNDEYNSIFLNRWILFSKHYFHKYNSNDSQIDD